MSLYPIRAHVEGCRKALSVPVDLCECGGRDFAPSPAVAALPDREHSLKQAAERAGSFPSGKTVRPATAEEQEPLVERLALMLVEVFDAFHPPPQRPGEPVQQWAERVKSQMLDHVRAAVRQVLVVIPEPAAASGVPLEERTPSAWSEFGDGHDYSRTGKHDPRDCRVCLRQIVDRAEAIGWPGMVEQFCRDLNDAHNEILRLQGVKPEDYGAYDWPEWSAPANSIRWAERNLGKPLSKTSLRAAAQSSDPGIVQCRSCGGYHPCPRAIEAPSGKE